MSVYFLHSKYADHHIENIYKTIEKHMMHNKKNESNKRGDWLKSWLMLNDYSALNTMFRRTPQKQTSFVFPKGEEKQNDYILTKRRYLRNVKDAEATDMIHMGSDHRCIMATFLINTLGKDTHARKKNK